MAFNHDAHPLQPSGPDPGAVPEPPFRLLVERAPSNAERKGPDDTIIDLARGGDEAVGSGNGSSILANRGASKKARGVATVASRYPRSPAGQRFPS